MIDVIRRTDGDEEIGSIGIGAMIVFIALILVAAVASTIIIKTAEELQQNAEATSQDTREQISGKVSITDVYIKTIANPLHVDDSRGGDARHAQNPVNGDWKVSDMIGFRTSTALCV